MCMFDYYTKIQQIIRNKENSQAKAKAFYEILYEIKELCGVNLGLSSENQFISMDLQNTKAGEVAEHLREAIVASDFGGDINDYKSQIIRYLNNEKELEVKVLENIFDFDQLIDRGEEYDKIAEKKLYKNWVLENNVGGVQWDKLLGDNFIDQSGLISSDTRSIKVSENETVFVKKDNIYDINHTLTDQEVKMLTWSKIAKETNVTLKEAVRDHYIGVVGDFHLSKDPEAKQLYSNIMLEALANVKENAKPSFISLCENGHWSTVSIMPHPSKGNEIAIAYLDSNLGQDALRVANDLHDLISTHEELGFTLKPQGVLDLSRQQQVNQCCGLAAASNNASLVKFYDTIKSLNDDVLDLDVMLQAFKNVESSYLFKPEVLPDSASFNEEVYLRNEYVRGFGQKEFDDLKGLVDHFQEKPVKSQKELDELLNSFDDKLVSQKDMEQIEGLKLEYYNSLVACYNELPDEQTKKDINFTKDLIIKELASDIGEEIGKKLFGENMSESRIEDTQAIVIHLKEIILPSLSSDELSQSQQYIQEIVGEVITSNALWQKAVQKDKQGLAQFYYDNATTYTNVGMLSSGIQLSHEKLKNLDASEINNIISSAISVNSQQMRQNQI